MSSAKPMSSISSASSSTTSADVVEAQRAPLDVVDGPARRGDDDVDAVAEGAELAADRLAAVDRQRPGRRARGRSGTSPRTPARRARGSGRARGRSGRRGRAVDELQRGQGERRRLAGAGGRLPEDVAAGEQLGDGVGLDRRRLLVPEVAVSAASSSGRRPSSSNVSSRCGRLGMRPGSGRARPRRPRRGAASAARAARRCAARRSRGTTSRRAGGR